MNQIERKDDMPRSSGAATEQGQKSPAQTPAKETKAADAAKSQLEKKPSTESNQKKVHENNSEPGSQINQRQKTKKTDESELHELLKQLNQMMEIMKVKDHSEIRNGRLAAREPHDLLLESRMNSDRKAIKQILDKLDAISPKLRGGNVPATLAEQIAAVAAGIKGLLGKMKSAHEKHLNQKTTAVPDTNVPGLKDLLVKIELLLEGVRGESSHNRSGAEDRGSGDSANYIHLKSDTSMKRPDASYPQQLKNSVFRESLDTIIQNAKVTVKDSQNGSFSVRLYPRELGSVNISLGLLEGVIHGKFLVETQEAKNLLMNNLEHMRQQLQDAGISVGEFLVNVNDQRGKLLRDTDEERHSVALPTDNAGEIKSEYETNSKSYHDGHIDVVI
ncbi:MAG: hypothetical protein A2176_07440 [Spirochaetes bacterium RBG_13_51_14]|nr:MAG: hypothetical protein A2176_07440 [Spirochaetes bacterium RBG_13_51_14]